MIKLLEIIIIDSVASKRFVSAKQDSMRQMFGYLGKSESHWITRISSLHLSAIRTIGIPG